MISNFICKSCKYKETDQLGDMVCTNLRSFLYNKYIEDELERLDECDYYSGEKDNNIKKLINESFINHKEFDNWALSLSNIRKDNIFKMKIDNGPVEYFSIIVYPDFDNLVLLSPLTIREIDEHLYNTDYPQIGPIDWKQLDLLEELDELEAVKEITKDKKANIMYD